MLCILEAIAKGARFVVVAVGIARGFPGTLSACKGGAEPRISSLRGELGFELWFV